MITMGCIDCGRTVPIQQIGRRCVFCENMAVRPPSFSAPVTLARRAWVDWPDAEGVWWWRRPDCDDELVRVFVANKSVLFNAWSEDVIQSREEPDFRDVYQRGWKFQRAVIQEPTP